MTERLDTTRADLARICGTSRAGHGGVGSLAVTALAVLISTQSPVVLVLAVLTAAGAMAVAVHGGRRRVTKTRPAPAVCPSVCRVASRPPCAVCSSARVPPGRSHSARPASTEGTVVVVGLTLAVTGADMAPSSFVVGYVAVLAGFVTIIAGVVA